MYALIRTEYENTAQNLEVIKSMVKGMAESAEKLQ